MASVPMKSRLQVLLFSIALLGATLPASGAPRTLHVQTDASHVKYFITHTLSDVRNTAGTASGDVQVEPVRGGAWRLAGTVSVDLRKLDTGIDQRTKHIKSAEYLDVEKFPLATFEFKSATCDSPHVHIPPPVEGEPAPVDSTAGPMLQRWKGRATGSFTMHGVARDMEIPVVCTWGGEALKVHGKFRIRLADHGIKRVKKMGLAAGETTDVTLDLVCAP